MQTTYRLFDAMVSEYYAPSSRSFDYRYRVIHALERFKIKENLLDFVKETFPESYFKYLEVHEIKPYGSEYSDLTRIRITKVECELNKVEGNTKNKIIPKEIELKHIQWGMRTFKGKELTEEDKKAVYNKIEIKANAHNTFSLHVSQPEYVYLTSIADSAGFCISLQVSGNDISIGNEDHWVVIGRNEAELNTCIQSI